MEHLDNLRAHLDNADEVIAAMVGGKPKDDSAAHVARLRAMVSDLPTERKGTMKAWFAGRTFTEVDTVQVGKNGKVWAPGPRMVEARATLVRLDGSVSDYKGKRVIAADDDTPVVHDTSGFDTVTIYRAVDINLPA